VVKRETRAISRCSNNYFHLVEQLQSDPFSNHKVHSRLKEGKPCSSFKSNLRGLRNSNVKRRDNEDYDNNTKDVLRHKDRSRGEHSEVDGAGNGPSSANPLKRQRADDAEDATTCDDYSRQLIKQNRSLEAEIKRIKLIKEQHKLKQELEMLKKEVDGHDDEGLVYREKRNTATMPLTPPMSTESNALHLAHQRETQLELKEREREYLRDLFS
jgi:hypothetical protein